MTGRRWLTTLVVLTASACATLSDRHAMLASAAPAGLDDRGGLASSDSNAATQHRSPARFLAREATLALEVGDPSASGATFSEQVESGGGYVERSTTSDDGIVQLTLRVPDAELEALIAAFSATGEVTRRSLTATDVTDAIVDADARLKNLELSRDRLSALFDKAQDAGQAVEVEKELARVQGEIESLGARLKSLRARVALAKLEVRLEREEILGPLGLLFHGIGWLGRKLVVWSE